MYQVLDLPTGTYNVRETQPVLFGQGSETVGTGSATNVVAIDNVFANIGLGPTQNAVASNFGEQRPTLSQRDLLAQRAVSANGDRDTPRGA